jgi:hypothetical protein
MLQLAEQVRKPRVPDLPKPPVYKGAETDIVEDRLLVFENYLRGSNIPEASWPNYIMSLLQDKALTAWTSVAVPASTAGIPVTWEMFKQTMLTNFAHPDRQHQAREQLHKIGQRTSQSATDYVRTFNSLVQRAGQPVPSTTDQILFFHSGLLFSFKEKCVTNPTTGMFWTDLHALQGHVIAMQTHGNLKQIELVPKTHTSINTARSFKPKRFNAIMHHTQRDETRPRREFGHGGGKYRQGRGASHVNKAGPSRVSHERAPTNSAEEKKRKIAFLQKQLAEQEAQGN